MTKLVGILNMTPDSFSDGGRYVDADLALAAISRMIDEGADVIDIGAESTRPGATPIGQEEEWERLAPVLSQLSRFGDITFSIDTHHAATAEKALDCGVHWVNDVLGFSDPEMVKLAIKSDCTCVVMHSSGVPADKNVVLPENADVTANIVAFIKTRLAALVTAGIARERLIFDPGIGFGKTPPQSLQLLRDIDKLQALDVPILVGHSRKSFLAGLSSDRDEATLAISQYLAEKNIDYIRVHDVAAHRKMLDILGKLHG